MTVNRKIAVMVCLAAVVFIGVAATTPHAADKKKNNLKILPRDIDHKELDKIMRDFNRALGVKCNFCHAQNAETRKMDFASDEKPEKEITRSMMKLTLDINKKYFHAKRPIFTDSTLSVTCNTCHKGVAHP